MKETFANLKKVYQYGKEYKRALILSSAFSYVFVIVNVIYPIWTAKQLMHLTNGIIDQLLIATVVVFAFDILRAVRMYIIRHQTQIFFRGTFKNLQLAVSREILRIRVRSLDENSSGIFIERMNRDCDELSHIFTMGTGHLTGIISKLGMFAAILLINPWLFLYYAVASAIVTVLHLRRVGAVNERDKALRVQKEENVGLTSELVRGVRDVKMLHASDTFLNRIAESITAVSEKTCSMRGAEMGYDLLIAVVTGGLEVILILLLVLLYTKENITAATAVVLFSYKSNIMVNLMQNVGGLLSELKTFNLSAGRVFSLLGDTEFEKETFGETHLDKPAGALAFENVTFGYDADRMVLTHFNLAIAPNETVGIVGKSGAGKSTVFNLLCRLYDVNDGCITVDGHDVRTLDEASLRGNITVIGQSPYIFHMSIRDNLRLVCRDLTDEDMKTACRAACLEDTIETLPDGYDTVVGEGGVTLSGGQRQRLAIARALLQKSRIILFDEATSALDNETQQKIKQAISNLRGDHTVLIIAHRFSTIIDCDRIFYLDGGKVLDSGTHAELLERCAPYRALYEAEQSTSD
ncbi:MAG: ABC transporter ATP-binding protein/permease [Clostridia bacterium]|nr:ABC transporter ATP-binding protein/permease [Clostridia bacterium]